MVELVDPVTRRLHRQPFGGSDGFGTVLMEAGFVELAEVRRSLAVLGLEAELMPMFRPDRMAALDDTGVAVIGYDTYGKRTPKPLMTIAAIERNCPSGLHRAIKNMSLFADRHVPGEGAHIQGDVDLLDRVSGRVAIIGAAWCAGEARGGALQALWPVILELALDRIKPDWVVGLIRGEKVGRLGFEIEGFRHFWPGMVYQDPDWGGGYQITDFTVCAMSYAHAKAIVARAFETQDRHASLVGGGTSCLVTPNEPARRITG